MELTICEKFQKLIPPQQAFEYQQLEENILRDGCTAPLDVWPHDGQNVIVDGHHRYKICKEHDIPFETHEVHFDSDDDAIIWIIKNQFGRRNLSNFHRAELVEVLRPLIAAKAKERQAEFYGNQHTGGLRENSHEVQEKGRTDETLAQISGISTNTIRRAKVIMEHGTPEQIERARVGGRGNTVNAIYTEIKHRDMEEKTCPMCGETLPIDRFYGEGATCKTCTEVRKQTLLSGGTVSYQMAEPIVQADASDALQKEETGPTTSVEDDRGEEFTAEDLRSLVDSAIENLDASLDIHLVSTDHLESLGQREGRELIAEGLKRGHSVIEKYLKYIRGIKDYVK